MVYRATVVSVDDDGLPSVEVPEFGTGYEFGPVQALVVGPWARGDRVLVDSVADILEDVVIIGRLDPTDGGGPGPGPGAFYEQTVNVPALEWVVPHGLGRLRPEVTLTDADGAAFFADVIYDSPTQLRVIHSVPTVGTVTVSA